jgi:uncharacterized protein (UPF0335 family)
MGYAKRHNEHDEEEIVLDGTVGGALDQQDEAEEKAENGNEKIVVSFPMRDADFNQSIVDAVERLNVLSSEQAANNAEKSSIKERLEAKGLPRKALKMAMDYVAMSDEQRKAFDAALLVIRAALGVPLQTDLLASQE